MRTCKDCPSFEYILIERNGCDGVCHEPNPARGELFVNSDWDEQGCPFYQMYVEEDEKEQFEELRGIIADETLEKEIQYEWDRQHRYEEIMERFEKQQFLCEKKRQLAEAKGLCHKNELI